MDIMGNSNYWGDIVGRDIQAFLSHHQMSLRFYTAANPGCLSSNYISLQKKVSGSGTVTLCERQLFLLFFGWFLAGDRVRVGVVIK